MLKRSLYMFLWKSKIDVNLKKAIDINLYKKYRVIIHCKNLQENIEKRIKSGGGKVLRSVYTIDIISASISSLLILRLAEYPEVSFITFDSFAFLCGRSVIHSNKAYIGDTYNLTGKNIGIGLIDSGVYPHPDLLLPRNKIKYFVDILEGIKYPYDDNGHGTFISGLISGSGHSSEGKFKGIAENSFIYCYKVFNCFGRAYVSDILFAIDDILTRSQKDNIKVLCLPFEILEYNPFIINCFSILFEKCIKVGLIPIVPSGSINVDEETIIGLGLIPHCITVSGVNIQDSIKEFKFSSSNGNKKINKPDIAANCVDLCSLNTDKDYISERNEKKLYPKSLEIPYTSYTGTSCAVAYISGVCALLFENNPSLTFKDLLSLLKVSSELAPISKSLQGNGIVNVNKLLP